MLFSRPCVCDLHEYVRNAKIDEANDKVGSNKSSFFVILLLLVCTSAFTMYVQFTYIFAYIVFWP